MPKLTDTQLVILSAASQRKDGLILPLPKSLKLSKASAASVLRSLLQRKLIAERPAASGEEVWREDADVKATLVITEAGQHALDGQPTETPAEKQHKSAGRSKPAAAAPTKDKDKAATQKIPQAESKLGILTNLLSRKTGATIAEAMKATGWQAHSIRGAISGALKKKQGLSVTSNVEGERGRVYRIAVGR